MHARTYIIARVGWGGAGHIIYVRRIGRYVDACMLHSSLQWESSLNDSFPGFLVRS